STDLEADGVESITTSRSLTTFQISLPSPKPRHILSSSPFD
ncbi:hypothetical protein LINPERHAP2_LOCUS20995, partial [Linum perenne]